MTVRDISVPIRPGMVVYEGDPEVAMERVASIAGGAPANLTRLTLGVHTGTHIDAPVHFIEGAPGSESLDLATLVGPAVVVDATAVDGQLDAAALARLAVPEGAERVLFQTTNGRLWDLDRFSPDFVSLTEDGARAIVAMRVRLVGIDYLSIGDPGAHRVLLGAGVVPLEGLDLRGVPPGRHRLVCLPLRLDGADGVPARAVLLDEPAP